MADEQKPVPPASVVESIQELLDLRAEDATWIARARPLDAFFCDAVFGVADTFYFGPENDFTERQWKEERIPLQPPSLVCRVPGEVCTADVLDREDELIAYYERLIVLARAHGKTVSLRDPFPYFRVTPTIIVGNEKLAHFSWTDDIPETESVLEALANSREATSGFVWDDQDQGWRISIATAGDLTYFIEWDAEGEPPADAGWAVDAAALANQAAEALSRLQTIHGRLVSALGQDYWVYNHQKHNADHHQTHDAPVRRRFERLRRWLDFVARLGRARR